MGSLYHWETALTFHQVVEKVTAGAEGLHVSAKVNFSDEELKERLLNACRSSITLKGLIFDGNQGNDFLLLASNIVEATGTLELLQFDGNRFGDQGFKDLAKQLPSCRRLHDFVCCENNLSLEAAKALAGILVKTSSLIKLNLRGNDISDAGLHAICLSLSYNRSLESLNVSRNNIYLESAFFRQENNSFTAMISDNDCLTDLNLSDNQISVNGARILARGMEINQTMKKLSLERNQCSDDGCELLFSALRANSCLKELNLSGVGLTSKLMDTLSAFLQDNESLLRLDLSHNEITESGCLELANALFVNDSLIQLNLRSNNINLTGATYLLGSIDRNSSLSVLNLDGNEDLELSSSGRSVVQEIKRSLKNNLESFVRKTQENSFKSVVKTGQAKAPWRRSKLMVVGQGRAGKTATIRSLLDLPFKDSLDSTVGVALSQTNAIQNAEGWKRDKIGGEDFLTQFAARIVVNSDRDEIEDIDESVKKENRATKAISTPKSKSKIMPKKNGRTGKRVVKKKSPLLTDKEIALKYSEELILRAKEEKDAIKFSIWDYGGQKVFYSMHHLFLTQYGVYLIVFDMREIIEHESISLDYLRFWLNSIKLHASKAPFLFVGTFLDCIGEDSKQSRTYVDLVNKAILKLVDSGDRYLIKNNEENLLFFPIDNRNRVNLAALRDRILKVSQTQSYISWRISLKWIKILDVLMELKPSISYRKVLSIAQAYDISSAEVNEMLSFFHEIGVLIYLRSTEFLRQRIITDPQWIIEKLCLVIRDPIHGVPKTEKDELKRLGFSTDMNNLIHSGHCSQDLLQFLWKSDYNYLLDVAKSALLISQFGKVSSSFVIPSMLADTKYTEFTDECVSVIFDFSTSFLPLGVFQRFLCLCITYSGFQGSVDTLKVGKHSALLDFGGIPVRLLETKDTIVVYLPTKSTEVPKVLQVVNAMMMKIKTDFTFNSDAGLVWNQMLRQVHDNSTKEISYHEAKAKKESPWFSSEVSSTGPKSHLEELISSMKLE